MQKIGGGKEERSNQELDVFGKANAGGCQVWKNIDARFDSRLDEAMRTIPLFLSGCIALLSLTLVCPAPAADTKIEQALRDLDAQWSKDAGTKDVDKIVSYYAESAVVMPPNASAATTKESIRSAWKEMLTTPGAAISWKATKVEVAKSGDLAYVSGTYQETMTDASGKSANDHGKYVEIFKKQADGTWKVVADIWNSDLPATAPAPSEKR
jgi:ketosteroid isomerase-like protein